LKPVKEGGVGLPDGLSRNPLICDPGHRAPRQGGLFGAESDFCVTVRRLQICVTKPRTNDVHIDTGFQEMDGRVVPPMSLGT